MRPADEGSSDALRDRLKDGVFTQTGADVIALQAELQELARQRDPETPRAGRRRP